MSFIKHQLTVDICVYSTYAFSCKLKFPLWIPMTILLYVCWRELTIDPLCLQLLGNVFGMLKGNSHQRLAIIYTMVTCNTNLIGYTDALVLDWSLVIELHFFQILFHGQHKKAFLEKHKDILWNTSLHYTGILKRITDLKISKITTKEHKGTTIKNAQRWRDDILFFKFTPWNQVIRGMKLYVTREKFYQCRVYFIFKYNTWARIYTKPRLMTTLDRNTYGPFLFLEYSCYYKRKNLWLNLWLVAISLW